MLTFHVCIFAVLSTLPINYAQDSFILAADSANDKVHKIDLTSGNVSSLTIQGVISVTDVLYDHKSKHMYVTDYRNRTIHRCTLSGTNCSTYQIGIPYPKRAALDFSTGNVYYIAEVQSFRGRPYRIIGIISPAWNASITIPIQLENPVGIVLYPSKGPWFWIDHASPYHQIGRSSMDGSNERILLHVGTESPNGITIDYSTDRIYWTSGYNSRIASCDLNGKYILFDFEDPGSQIMDIVIQGSYIYYSALNRSIITKVREISFKVTPWMNSAPQFGRINSISIYPAESQPNNRICSNNNGGCKTFCIPITSTTVVCKCNASVADSTCQTEDSNTPTYCNNSIPNGSLENGCTRNPGTSCNYNCEKGYKKIKEQMINCLVNGQWSENVTSLCQEIRCHINIPHGRFVSQCMGKTLEVCFFMCLDGYYSTSGTFGIAYCKTDGQWNTSITSACKEHRVDSKQSSSQFSAMIGAGAGAGIGVIVVALVVAVFVIRKGFPRRSRSGEQVQVNKTTYNTESGAPAVHYLPDNPAVSIQYLTPIAPPRLYDEIDTHSRNDVPCYQNLEKGSKPQNGTTGNRYANLNDTTETNPYMEPY